MLYREFGRTGWKVSAIEMGAWKLLRHPLDGECPSGLSVRPPAIPMGVDTGAILRSSARPAS